MFDNSLKQIFDLRKQGRLREAYDSLLPLLPQNYPDTKIRISQNKWLAIATMNVLIDLLKYEQSLTPQSSENISYLSNLLSGIDAEDDINAKHRIDRVLKNNNPYISLVNQAYEIPKDGPNNDKAINLLLQFREKAKDNSEDKSIAWRIYYFIKYQLSLPHMAVSKILDLFHLYFNLNFDDRNVRVLILIAALRVIKQLEKNKASYCFNFPSFVKTWGLENLDSSNWERNADGKFKSTAEEVITICAKELAKEKEAPLDLIEYFIPYLKELINRDSSDIWNYLYLSRMLCKLGQNFEAKVNLIKVIKQKLDASWAWTELANLYSEESPQKAIGCYCKALLCKDPEDYKVNIHKNFSEYLFKQNDLRHAKTEYQLFMSLKQNPSEYDYNVTKMDWFVQTETDDNNSQFYEENVTYADEILFEDLPNILGVVGPSGHYFNEIKKKHVYFQIIYIKLKTDSNDKISFPFEIKNKLNKEKDSLLKEGDCIHIKGELGPNYKFNIYTIKKCNDSTSVFDPEIGIIDHINKEKELVHIIISQKYNLTVPMKQLKNVKLKQGTAIKMHISYSYTKENEKRLNLVKNLGSVDIKEAPSELWCRFNGCLSCVPEMGFGFVDNVFLQKSVLVAADKEDGDCVSGIAVLSFNKKKGRWGYIAVTID